MWHFVILKQVIRNFVGDELIKRLHGRSRESTKKFVNHVWLVENFGVEECVAKAHERLLCLILGVEARQSWLQQAVAETEGC